MQSIIYIHLFLHLQESTSASPWMISTSVVSIAGNTQHTVLLYVIIIFSFILLSFGFLSVLYKLRTKMKEVNCLTKYSELSQAEVEMLNISK